MLSFLESFSTLDKIITFKKNRRSNDLWGQTTFYERLASLYLNINKKFWLWNQIFYGKIKSHQMSYYVL